MVQKCLSHLGNDVYSSFVRCSAYFLLYSPFYSLKAGSAGLHGDHLDITKAGNGKTGLKADNWGRIFTVFANVPNFRCCKKNNKTKNLFSKLSHRQDTELPKDFIIYFCIEHCIDSMIPSLVILIVRIALSNQTTGEGLYVMASKYSCVQSEDRLIADLVTFGCYQDWLSDPAGMPII